jgi:hypothetical protein
MSIFYCLHFWDSLQPVFISLRNRLAPLYPRAWGYPIKLKLKCKLLYDRRSVGQSVLVSGSHLEPMTSFLSDDCGFLDKGHPLCREDGSVIYLYSCFWALPEQSLLGQIPAEVTVSFETSPYLDPPGTGRPRYY